MSTLEERIQKLEEENKQLKQEIANLINEIRLVEHKVDNIKSDAFYPTHYH